MWGKEREKERKQRLLRSSTWGHHSRAEVPPSIGVGRAKDVTEIAKKTIGPQPKLSLTPEFLEPLRIKSLLALWKKKGTKMGAPESISIWYIKIQPDPRIPCTLWHPISFDSAKKGGERELCSPFLHNTLRFQNLPRPRISRSPWFQIFCGLV